VHVEAGYVVTLLLHRNSLRHIGDWAGSQQGTFGKRNWVTRSKRTQGSLRSPTSDSSTGSKHNLGSTSVANRPAHSISFLTSGRPARPDSPLDPSKNTEPVDDERLAAQIELCRTALQSESSTEPTPGDAS
jgi:hypothetical protein